jgi:hypothetical protein
MRIIKRSILLVMPLVVSSVVAVGSRAKAQAAGSGEPSTDHDAVIKGVGLVYNWQADDEGPRYARKPLD